MDSHVRLNGGLLAAAEKRLLVRIAGRLPRWVHSDLLTLLALGAMLLAGTGFAVARWDRRGLWLVLLGLGLNWFGDSLDGTVARVRHVERPRYGYYVDHALDLAGTTLLLGGLAYSGYMTPVIALAVLIGYLLVAGEVFLATAVNGVFRMSVAGVGPTELRIVLGAGTLALFRDPHVPLGTFGRISLFDFGGAIAAGGLAVAFVAAVMRNASTLRHEEHRRVPTTTNTKFTKDCPFVSQSVAQHNR